MDSGSRYDDAELLAYSGEHLFYEFDMLVWCLEHLTENRWQGSISPNDTQGLRNALLESFAIHLRNLITFFYTANPRPTDVIADDFLAQGHWKAIRPKKSEQLTRAEDQANKQIAHLTMLRYAGSHERKQWATFQLAAEIVTLMKLFVEHACDTRLSPKFRQLFPKK